MDFRDNRILMQTFPTPIPGKKGAVLLLGAALVFLISLLLMSASKLQDELSLLNRDQVVSVRIAQTTFNNPRDVAAFSQSWLDNELHIALELRTGATTELDILDRAGKHHRFKLSSVKGGEEVLIDRNLNLFTIKSKELANALKSYHIDIR
jgi:hypothetical protein